MKKKVIIILCLSVAIVLALAWCGKEKEVAIDYGTSELFSQADMDDAIIVDSFDAMTEDRCYSKGRSMDDAIKEILKKSNTFKGCELYSLSYTSDERCEEELEYRNKHASEGTTYDACIVFDSSFHSPVSNAGAWEPNTLYTWSWYLVRTDNSNWKLVGYGYG